MQDSESVIFLEWDEEKNSRIIEVVERSLSSQFSAWYLHACVGSFFCSSYTYDISHVTLLPEREKNICNFMHQISAQSLFLLFGRLIAVFDEHIIKVAHKIIALNCSVV